MKLKKCFLLIFSIGFSVVHAQNEIKGKITDVTKVALPYANIILYNEDNKTAVAGVISNDNGNYQFKNIENGTYSIEVSVLGFKTKKTELFQLFNANKTLNFVLEEETQALNEVVVKSNRPTIKQTAEKLIVNLENSEMINNNLQDVVKKVPGIIMTNGKISYAGQGNIRILINGKTTNYMDTSTLLKDFPAYNIAKVELIQQPGAEYDAEGSGPILNIILKKNVKFGTHGNISAMMGYENDYEYQTNASIASYKNKLNWQASAGYSKFTSRDDLALSRKVLDKTYSQTSISPFDPTTLNASGSLNYYLNDNHSFGISSRIIDSNSDRITNNNTTITDASTTEILLTDNSFKRNRTTYTINPYYEFEDEKNKITLDYNYVNYEYNNENNLFRVGESSVAYDNQRYFQEATYKINTYRGDYKKQVTDNFTWSLGSKYAQVDSNSDLQSFTQDANGVFQPNTNQSNRFLVDETIIALYSKMNLNLNKWNFSAGLRWEESNTKGTATATNETRERKISKLFPSASIGREITENLGANIAYSYRLQRPSYNSLNSFVYYYDPYTFEEGNPNLKPAFTNSYRFNLTFDEQPFFSVEYKETSDALFEIITQNDTSAETSRSNINVSKNKNWSFSLFAPINFIGDLDGYTGVIVNHNTYFDDGLTPELNLNKWSFTWFTSAEYELPWEINSEISGFYSNGGLEGIIEYKWLAGIDIAFGKNFFNDRLKVNLAYEEILNRKFNGTINYDNVNATVVSDWARHNVFLELNYSFGSKFSKNKNRTNSSKEEQDRIKNDN